MPNGRSPFAGGPLIRRGFEMLANQEEQELAEELRRLRLERARNRERRDEARFRRRFDFRPEGATTIEPTEAAEQPPESVGERPERPPPTVGRGGTVRADRLARSLEGGAASDGTPSTGPGRTIADEMRDLRSTGGAELTPGDVREPEALGRALDMRTVEEPGPATRSAPAAEQPGRIPLSGGGSISRESPEQRRRQEQAQKLRQTLGEAFPDADPARVDLAAMTGDPGILQEDTERANNRVANAVASAWMEAGPNTSARDIQRRTGAPLEVVGMARDRIETAQPDFFPEAEDEEEPDFLNTEEGQQAFERFANDPDADPVQVARDIGTENLTGVLEAREEASDGAGEEPPSMTFNQAWDTVKELFGEEDAFTGRVTFPGELTGDGALDLAQMMAEGDPAARQRMVQLNRQLSPEAASDSVDQAARQAEDEGGGFWDFLPGVGDEAEADTTTETEESGVSRERVQAQADRAVREFGSVDAAITAMEGLEDPDAGDRAVLRELRSRQ